MFLPPLIYEATPLIYSSTGLAAIFNLDPPIGKAAGGLLILVAIVISHLRRKYRGL